MCRHTRLLHRPACCRKAFSCPDGIRITQQGRETLMPCIPAATADTFQCHACYKDIASAKALHMHVAQSVAHTSVWLSWAVRSCSSSSITCWALILATKTKLWPKHPNNTANNTVPVKPARFERLDGVMTVAQKVFGSYVSLSCISLVHLNKHYASCF